MRTISRVLMILALGCFTGCDVEEDFEPSEATPDFTVALHEQFEETEVTDIALPSEGICANGYWAHKTEEQSCGSCWHTIPNPDRPGTWVEYYKRWCWIGPGCGGCQPWVYVGAECHDDCQ